MDSEGDGNKIYVSHCKIKVNPFAMVLDPTPYRKIGKNLNFACNSPDPDISYFT